jgi:hypothetical protein
MIEYIPTEKTPKYKWSATEQVAALEALGTPEAQARAAMLRRTEVVLYRMGGYGRWIARKDAEQGALPGNPESAAPD